MERVVRKFETPEAAAEAVRDEYRSMTPNARVAVTVALQRAYFSSHDPPQRLPRLLRLLNDRRVEFLVLGGHAVSFHGYPRFTHDIDLFIRPARENALRLLEALSDFGFGTLALTADDFVVPVTVVLGRAPEEIDLMTYVLGVPLEDVWADKVAGEVDSVPVFFISKAHLIRNKEAVGRPEDRADVACLR